MAFYARDTQAAATSLKAAQARIDSLRVPDELLVALQEMGESDGCLGGCSPGWGNW